MPADSGWQFMCGTTDEEDPGLAEVWGIFQLVHYDPSIAELLPHEGVSGAFARRDFDERWERVRGESVGGQ
ncbi:MAG: DUF2185 domain-containing protein [Planctomycetes bacterium]|nr:DUF2185 domain-containing protein [Planctomycetota bacterium]